MLLIRLTTVHVLLNKTLTYFSAVKPGPVSRVMRLEHNTTSMLVAVYAPHNLDDAHLKSLPKAYPLLLEYTATFLPEEQQNLRHSERSNFFKEYGFVRNLDDDIAAFREVANCLPNNTVTVSIKIFFSSFLFFFFSFVCVCLFDEMII
jgi:hypothetical protein